MPRRATEYIYSVIGIGVAVLLEGLRDWNCADWRRFLAYLGLAMLGSALKVRMPGMPGTCSLSYLFVLMATIDLSYSESLAIAAVAAAVQCLWQAKPRPSIEQVLFNVAVFMICIAVYSVVIGVPFLGPMRIPTKVVVFTVIFFAVNTLFVSGIISILQSQGVRTIWRAWFAWFFLYYLAGSVLAGAMILVSHAYGWTASLNLLPAVFVLHFCYRRYMTQAQ